MTPIEARAIAIERLLEEQDWAHRLARSLVSDPASADDLVQEAWIAALVRPPDRLDAPHAWLGTVLRRAFGKSQRSMARRKRREGAAARREELPSAAELAVEAEMHARLAKAVLALEEPYRETILHRFFDGAPPREVARRMGVPVETARTRIRRAIAFLRAALDPQDPDRRKRAAIALLALARRAGVGIAVPASVAVAAAALAIAAGVAWAVGVSRGGEGDLDSRRAATEGAGATLASAPSGPSATATPPARTSRTRWSFRACDAMTGKAVASAVGRDVSSDGPDASADADGRIALTTVGDGRHTIAIWAEGYAGSTRSRLAIEAPESETVFLWPVPPGPGARRVAGRVRDGQGKPVAGAVVRGVGRRGIVYVARSDDSGEFGATCAWSAVPAVWVVEKPGAGAGAAVVTFEGRREWEPVPEVATIELARSVDVPVRIRGDTAGLDLVVHAEPATRWLSAAEPREGSAADGAILSVPPGAWRLSLRTRADEAVARDVWLLVTARGMSALGVVPDAETPDGIVLGARAAVEAAEFDVEARSLRVRVLDEAGPVAGASVTLEPAGESDAFVWKSGEYGPSHPSRRAGLSGFFSWGRRASLESTRNAVTGVDGVATIRGSIPAPARFRVRGPVTADAFHDVTDSEVATGGCEVRVERGAAVDVAWPSWLRDAALERVDGPRAGEAYRVGESTGPAVVPPGRYVLRVREIEWASPPGKLASDDGVAVGAGVANDRDPVVVLHGPFEVKSGEIVVADLRALTAPLRSTLLFEVPGRPWISCVPIWAGYGASSVVEGSVSFPRLVHLEKERFGFGWTETSGGLEVERFHEVDVSTAGRSSAGRENRFDVRYEGFSRRLRIRNREDDEVLVVVGVGREANAPYLDQHRASFLVPARAEREVTLSHLPAGTWWVAAVGPGRATAWPDRFEVGAAESEPVDVVLHDDTFLVRVTDRDGKPLQDWLHVKLVPHELPAAKEAWAELQGEFAWFARVPAGRWRLSVVGPARVQPRPDRTASEPWVETEIVVDEDSRSVSVVVAPRSVGATK